MANLLAIIKELKRRDLVHMIKKHIQEHYEQPEVVLNLVRSAVDSSGLKHVYTRNQSDEQRSSSPCCVQDCCCCKLMCYSSPCCDLPCCCVILAIFFTFLTVAAILAWFADIPEDIPSFRVLGYSAIPSCRSVIPPFRRIGSPLSLHSGIYYFRFIRNDRSSIIQDMNSANDQVICSPGSNTASNSVRTTPVLTRDDSFNSNPVTASCSLSSVEPRIPQLPELESVPDGLHKFEDDNVEFFTPNSSRYVSQVSTLTQSYADPGIETESD
ncbi:hypothetical protein ACROYT_G036570 [Oculina patagonica]